MNDSGCSCHQDGPQSFIAGSCDTTEPQLAAGRVIFGRQPYPGCELAARLEQLRSGCLHDQKSRTDWADAGNGVETSAAFVVTLPCLYLGLHIRNLPFQLSVFLGLAHEQFLCELWHSRVGVSFQAA